MREMKKKKNVSHGTQEFIVKMLSDPNRNVYKGIKIIGHNNY